MRDEGGTPIRRGVSFGTPFGDSDGWVEGSEVMGGTPRERVAQRGARVGEGGEGEGSSGRQFAELAYRRALEANPTDVETIYR